MARKTKKWYVVIVGKDVGVFATWSEAASLIKHVPGAIHESFNTEEEARRVFLQANENGKTKVVGNRSLQSNIPSTLQGNGLNSFLIPLVARQPQEYTRERVSPPKTRASPLPILYHNVTHTPGPSSSPTVSSRTSRHAFPHVAADTPPDLTSYPSDIEEEMPSQEVKPSTRYFSSNPVGASSQLSPRITARTSSNREIYYDGGHSRSSVETQTPLSPPMFLTTTSALPPSPPTLPLTETTPLRSTQRQCHHICPHCGPMVPLSFSQTLPSDPRSPLRPTASLTSQLNYLTFGRLSPPLTVED